MSKPKVRTHGQKQGREERVRKYEEFTGSKLAEEKTPAYPPDSDTFEIRRINNEVSKHLQSIKTSLTLCASAVICTVDDREVYDQIKGFLTKAQLEKVQFPNFE